MRMLGLDPGLAQAGWGIVDCHGQELNFIACGHVASDSKTSLENRLNNIFHAICEVAQEHKPVFAILETPFLDKNPMVALKLGAARGVMLAACAEYAIAVEEISPRAIKSAVTGSGRADKQQVYQMVRRFFPGRDIPSQDAADALAAAIAGGHIKQSKTIWASA